MAVVKVSVVVPVYNPGQDIEPCIRSVLDQTMPPEEFEVVFVDDGATDGTAERLDRLAAAHPHIQVHHQENSGWPSRPRNAGIDLSTGTYVQFLDQDDELGPQALDRLYAIAERNTADIVLGKTGGSMRGGAGVWRETVECCPGDDPLLMESLTPHKLFRRDFLDRHRIRFSEEHRRLEDQIFMVQAYLAAERVSILADYPCYYWQRRSDGGNASQQRRATHARDYYTALRHALDLVAAAVPAGPGRDRLQARFVRNELLGQLQKLPQQPEPYRTEMYREVHALVVERLTPGIERDLSPVNRARAALTVQDRPADLIVLAERLRGTHAEVRLTGMQWRAGRLHLRMAASMRYADGQPVVLVERHGRRTLDPRLTAGTALSGGLDVGDSLGPVSLHATLRHRAEPVDWYAPVLHSSQLQPLRRQAGRALQVTLTGTLILDPATWQGGAPAANGLWDVRAAAQTLGLSGSARIGADRSRGMDRRRQPCLYGTPTRVAVPYWTRPGDNLSLQITRPAGPLIAEVARRGVGRGRWTGHELRVRVPVAAAPGTLDLPVTVVLSSGAAARTAAGTVVSRAGHTQLAVPGGPGHGWRRLALRETPRRPPVPIGTVLLTRVGHQALAMPHFLGAAIPVLTASARAVLPRPARRGLRRLLRRVRRP